MDTKDHEEENIRWVVLTAVLRQNNGSVFRRERAVNYVQAEVSDYIEDRQVADTH